MARRVRLIGIGLLVTTLLACGPADDAPRVRTAAEVTSAIEPPGWDLIVARARPLVPPGPPAALAELTAAHAIARRHVTDWGDVRRAIKDALGKDATPPPAPLARFPEADAAIAGLVRWAAAGGSVPPVDGADPDTMPGFTLAMVAILTADATRRDALLAAASYGVRLLTEGATLIEGMLGLTIVRAAMGHAHALGQPLPATMVPPDEVIARMMAAEAGWATGMVTEQLSSAGIAAARAKGQRPTEREARTLLASMRARNQWWQAALTCAPVGAPRAALATCFAAERPANAPGRTGSAAPAVIDAVVADPWPSMQPYVNKLVTLLDDLHAHGAQTAPVVTPVPTVTEPAVVTAPAQ